MREFACEKEWKLTLSYEARISTCRSPVLALWRLFWGRFGRDSACSTSSTRAVESMKFKTAMPLPPILTASRDTPSMVVFKNYLEFPLSGKKCSTRQH